MTEPVGIIDQAEKAVANKTGKYLTFTLDREEYGIGILAVKEIIGIMPITPVPLAQAYVKGVINLRGKVIPVVDLRLKFAMAEIPYSDRTCIIVVEMDAESGAMLVGIVVDAVSEVVAIQEEVIEDAPAFGTCLDTAYILGMAKLGNSVKILLDIDRVLTADECEGVKEFS